MTSRRATTLVELIVALTLAALVLGVATTSLLRQQRVARRVNTFGAGESQLRAAFGVVVAGLSGLAASAGDVAAGEASDTALQVRSLVADGLACDTSAGAVALAPIPGESGAGGGPTPRPGDSLWWYSGSAAGWRARLVTGATVGGSGCPLFGGAAQPDARLTFAGADTVERGSPLRVTRPARFVFYRSGDGSWQLGLREWSEPTRRFAAPQPIAGPFVRRQAPFDRSGFRYFDRDGAELPAGMTGADVARIARIRITALTVDGIAHAAGDSVRRDSLDVALQRTRAP